MKNITKFLKIWILSLMFIGSSLLAYVPVAKDMVLIAEANSENNRTVSIGIFTLSTSQAVETSQVYIDWGDDTSSNLDAEEGTGIDRPNRSEHTYSSDGNYTIAIHANSGYSRIALMALLIPIHLLKN